MPDERPFRDLTDYHDLEGKPVPVMAEPVPTKECEVCHRRVPVNDWDYGVCNPCRVLAGAIEEGDR